MENGEGPQFWRSLDQLADTEEFRRYLEDEFPDRTPDWNEPSQRRTFLKIMGASLGLAGLAGCAKQPPEHIVPYVREPEEFVPGKPLFFATAMEMGGYATGLLVESHLGRNRLTLDVPYKGLFALELDGVAGVLLLLRGEEEPC